MRRAALIAILALSLGVAGCGGGEEVSPTPETVQGTLPEAATTEETATGETTTSTLEGDPAKGEDVFASAGCGGCHTLEAAGSSGNVGPNLDDCEAADASLVVDRVTTARARCPRSRTS